MRKLLVLLTLIVLSANGYSESLRVFVSVIPIKTFVEKVGGANVEVHAMVRPGFNPHTYDPTPQQIGLLSSTVLYVRTGVPFEKAWMKRIRSANPGMQVLDARDGLTVSAMQAHLHENHIGHENHNWHDDHGHDDHDGHDHHMGHNDHNNDSNEIDPHVWTNPELTIQMIGRIRDKLIELDPANSADYVKNHDDFLIELDALNQELQELLHPLKNRKFMVFHPAWGYFADKYQLIQVPIEDQGKEAGARRLVSLIEQAKHENIKVIFVQPQFDKRQAAQVALEINGSVIPVDPLAAEYVDNLRYVGQQIAQALR